jgi:hypothetical protein
VNAPVLFCSIACSCPPQHQFQLLFSAFPPLLIIHLSFASRSFYDGGVLLESPASPIPNERVITLLTSRRRTKSSLHYRPHDSSAVIPRHT